MKFLLFIFFAVALGSITIPSPNDLYKEVIDELKARFNNTDILHDIESKINNNTELDMVISKLQTIADLLDKIDQKIPVNDLAAEIVKELDMKRKFDNIIADVETNVKQTTTDIAKLETKMESSITNVQTSITDNFKETCKDNSNILNVIAAFCIFNTSVFVVVITAIIYYNYKIKKSKLLNRKSDTTDLMDWTTQNAKMQPLNEVELN